MTEKEISTRYDHAAEPELYDAWQKAGAFKPTGEGEPFSIVIPPPNVTGDLHLGHALTYGIQDTIGRHQRRLGKDVLILPGMDHAAIAVQALVEKKIQKEKGLSRSQIGREKFLEEVWLWIKHYMPRMESSLKRLGLSADWDRFRFTMDEHSQAAVRTAFVRLYQKGLIYRGEYMVNWDPKLQTAISDDEVIYEERPSKLYWIKYGPITLATTRPETKFGDTAIAVHPDDERYKKYVGQNIEVVMVTGEKKTIPVIADEMVDPKFGTGAVKITPAHDPDDFAAGKRHNLPAIQVIDKYGKLTDVAGEFAGMKAAEAREVIAKKMGEMGLMEKVTDYTSRVPTSERSGAVIEPLISTQWFVKTTDLKKRSIEVIKKGEIKFHPKSLEKTYYNWLDNLHDWCISRQLWWGHQIPAWYDETGKLYVAENEDAAQKQAGGKKLTQDQDVLDTWFSSGLWPFSTMGWPNNDAPDLERYFPTSLLETSSDIIFFWVARMIMLSLALTDEIPFKDVYFHGLILDEQGKKMSKSLGNVMDPLELVNKHSSDALRMSLIGGNSAGLAQKFSEQKVLKYRNFVTKIWNASRFVVMSGGELQADQKLNNLSETEAAFFKRLEKIEKSNTKLFSQYKIGLALEEFYEFFWHDFADKFIEEEKKVLLESKDKKAIAAAKASLGTSLARLLTMLSDFAPFVTATIKNEMVEK